MIKSRFLIALSLVLVGASSSDAATLFEQLPGPGSSNFTESSALNNNFGGGPGTRLADNFQLASGGTVRTVEWWGYLGLGGADYQITFYADASGGPGSPLSTMSVNPATFVTSLPAPFPVTFYSAILSTPFSAMPGTPYWVSVFDAAPGSAWFWWSANVNTDFGRLMQNGASIWDPNTDRNFVLDRPFRLTDDVPAPATFSLLAIATLGFACFRTVALSRECHLS